MRITGGEAARRILKVPKGLDVRPTPDLVKQAVFNSLGARILDAKVLELFAGSGALSLECLSRGAVSVLCIEKSQRHAEFIRSNAAAAGYGGILETRTQDVFPAMNQLAESGKQFDLILADPPYGEKNVNRRAVKSFDPTHQFTKQETEQLLDLAMQAPSSFNIQHWRLVNVTDKALRAKLREAAFDQAQVTEASLLFVVTVDIKAWEKDPARYWVNAPKEAQDILVPWINPFYSGNEQLQRDEAMRSAGIMLQTMMLSAKAMGYDSCPMVGFDFDKVAQLMRV